MSPFALRFVGRALLRSARRFPSETSGGALVEFGLMSPVLMLLLGISVILGEGLTIAQKVTLTARTIVDIVSKNSQLSTAQLSAILNASAYTMAPYSSSSLSMVVAEIQTNSAGAATVTWSTAAFGGTALTQGSAFTLPSGMGIANTTYIYGQVSYLYSPISLGYMSNRSFPLSDQAFFSPRVSTAVQYPYPN